MTILTRDARIHVSAMIEAGVSGKIVDFDPCNRMRGAGGVCLQLTVQTQAVIQLLHFGGDNPPRRLIGPQGFNVFLKRCLPVRRNEPVAVHADAGCRESGMRAFFGGEMAIQAGDFQLTSVQPVRECHWLFRRVSLLVARERVTREPGYQFE